MLSPSGSRRLVHVAAAARLATVLAAPATAGGPLPCIPQLPPGTPLSCPPPPPPPPPPAGRGDLQAFHGLGTWVDAYDYSREYGGANPSVPPSAVEQMAADGVRTLFLEAAMPGTSAGVLDPDLVGAFLTRAHAKHMAVVAWYLPRFGDMNDDWKHLDALLTFRANHQAFDAVGVDIEWRNDVPNDDERSQRLVDESTRLRNAAPNLPLAAIVMPPVVTDEINPSYWPRFPWAAIKPLYDVWMPMSYWTYRTGSWRDAYHYTVGNVDELRHDLNAGSAPVHPIGGIDDQSSTNDYSRFAEAARSRHCLGGSSYDYATTAPSAWAPLRTVPS